jgi:hypothetical protein
MLSPCKPPDFCFVQIKSDKGFKGINVNKNILQIVFAKDVKMFTLYYMDNNIPLKKYFSEIVSIRVDQGTKQDLYKLKSLGVDVCELLRRQIDDAIKKAKESVLKVS